MVNLKVNRFHCDNLGMENIDPYQSGKTGGHESILVGSFEGGAFGKHCLDKCDKHDGGVKKIK